MGSFELKAGDFVVRTNGISKGTLAVFLGVDENGDQVVKYAGSTSPSFILASRPEFVFRFATADEIARAAAESVLPSLTPCPKNQHYNQPAGYEKAVTPADEQFSPLVETSTFTGDEAKGFLPR